MIYVYMIYIDLQRQPGSTKSEEYAHGTTPSDRGLRNPLLTLCYKPASRGHSSTFAHLPLVHQRDGCYEGMHTKGP